MEFDGVAWVFAASTKVEKGLAENFVCWRNIECIGRVVSPDWLMLFAQERVGKAELEIRHPGYQDR